MQGAPPYFFCCLVTSREQKKCMTSYENTMVFVPREAAALYTRETISSSNENTMGFIPREAAALYRGTISSSNENTMRGQEHVL